MPRQPTLLPEEMRMRFLEHAEQIIAEHGLKKATARSIAARSGYTAGTLYTCFRSLDDLLMQLQISVLERLKQNLIAARDGSAPDKMLLSVTESYLEFAHQNRELWSLVNSELQQSTAERSTDFMAALNANRAIFADAQAKQAVAQGKTPQKNTADLIWTAIHGLSTIATSRKLEAFSSAEMTAMAQVMCTRLNT